MILIQEINLQDFEAWSGAVDTLETVAEYNKTEQLETILNDLYPNGMTDTELNDLLWHDTDAVYEWLGIDPDLTEFDDGVFSEEVSEVLNSTGAYTKLAKILEQYSKSIDMDVLAEHIETSILEFIVDELDI